MANTKEGFIPFAPLNFSEEETHQRAEDFYELMNKRRSLRMFSDKPVPKAVIEILLEQPQPHQVARISNLGLFAPLVLLPLSRRFAKQQKKKNTTTTMAV